MTAPLRGVVSPTSLSSARRPGLRLLIRALFGQPAVYAVLALACWATPAHAQLYWDTNRSSAGSGGPSPSGIWDTSTSNWNNTADGGGGTSRWSAGNSAVFSAGTDATSAYTVTIAAGLTLSSVYGITFEEGEVTIAGGNSSSLLGLSGAINTVAGTHTISAAIGGAGTSVSKQGAGTLVLSGNNSFGQLSLMAGKVNVSSDANIGAPSATVQFYGGTLGVTSSFSTGRRFAFDNGSGGFDVAGVGTTLTLTESLHGSMSYSLTKTGSGTLDLTKSAFRSGPNFLNEGTIRLTHASGLGNGQITIGAATLQMPGVALPFNNFVLNNGANVEASGFSSHGTSGGAAHLNVTNGAAVNFKTVSMMDVLTFNSELRHGDTTSLVTISGPGTVVLAKGTYATANSYNGSIALTEGTLRVTDREALATTGLTTGRPVAMSGGTLELRVDAASDFRSSLTITGDAAVVSNRTTAGAGVGHALGALNIGGQQLSITPGSGATSGTQALAFGATTLSGNATFNVNNSATAKMQLTLGPVSQDAAARSFTKTGSGTLLLTGAGTFTGTTTVHGGTLTAAATSGSALGTTGAITVNAGGTLALGAADQINNSAPIGLAGGTFSKGDFSEGTAGARGIGALTLSGAGSAVDFGTGTAGVLSFASFTPGSFTLTIENWTGTANTVGSGTSDRLIFNSDQTANLAAFTFTGYEGAAQFTLADGFYEIAPVTPVPEPATYLAGILALAGLVSHARRRRKSLAACARRGGAVS